MKKRNIILIVAVMLGLATMLAYRQCRQVGNDTNKSDRIQRSKQRPELTEPTPETRAKTIFDALEKAQASIVFYGRVVDDNDQPISNAKVDYQIIKPGDLLVTGLISQKVENGSVSSDQNGDFEISGLGESLAITAVRKFGFRESQGRRHNFGFFGGTEIHKPDKNHRQVFVLLPDTIADEIQHVSGRISLSWDGKPLRIDLISGKPSPSGALVITASRSGQRRNFDWQFSLAITGGELQEVANGTGLIAPSTGYLLTWQCAYKADDKPWRFGRDAIIFYHYQGLYGRLDLRIYADGGPGDVSLHFENYVNNSGGRNTERIQ